MEELSQGQKDFLALADSVDKVRGQANIRDMFGGRKQMEHGIDELIDMGLIERVAYGYWRITSKGEQQVVGVVACNDCNKEFGSLEDAQASGVLGCCHENLSFSLKSFTNNGK